MATKVHFVGSKTPITFIFGKDDTLDEEMSNVIKSNTNLFPDDTILTIKQKILRELQGVLPKEDGTFNSNDLYLFATVYRSHPHPSDWVQYIQNQKSIKKQVVFKQLLSNLGYSKKEIDETSVSIPEDYALETLDPWIINHLRIPLGMRPLKTHASSSDFFPVHPFDSYSFETEVEWVSHQNETLLEYGELVKPVLYACLYRDIPDEYRNKYGMINRVVKTTPQVKEGWQRMDKLKKVYEWTQENNTGTSKSGITHLELEWINPEYVVLPLEIIFKNIHANREVPFIKWKNIFRLYCPTRDYRGVKIPELSKMEISKIDRENVQPNLILWKNHGLIIHLMKNGNLQIHIERKTPTPIEELQQMVLETVKPIFIQLNKYLRKTGFSYLISWDTLFRNDPTVVRFSNIQWKFSAKLEMENTIQKKHFGFFEPAFVLLKANSEKKVSDAVMIYRRVSNYDTLNELKEIVRLEIGDKKTGKTGKIVSELEERGFSREKIQAVVQEVLEELQAGKQYFQKKEKGIGCPVTMVQIHDEIQFTVDKINFLENTRVIQQYIEAFIQQVFYKKNLPKSLIIPLIHNTKPLELPIDETENDSIIEQNETEGLFGENNGDEDKGKDEDKDNKEDEDGDETGVLLFNDEDEDGDETGVLLFNDEDEDETGVLLFNDEDEYEDGNRDGNERQEVKKMIEMNIPDVEESPSFMAGGAKKPNTSFSILNRLKERDPELFDVPDQNGKVYSRICPGSSSRYPIVLSKEEKKRIDKKDAELNQESYTEPLEYKKNTYICPRYWNFRENRSMNQAEFDSNPSLLQNLIVDEKDINNDANNRYIYEFKKGKRFDNNNAYKEHVPGFSSKNKNGFCLPCCFSEKDSTFKKNIKECKSLDVSSPLQVDELNDKEKEDDDEEPTKKNRGERGKDKVANVNYILGINIYPLEANRWGQIPPPVQNVINNRGKKEELLLRYGVDRKENQSFLACFADLLNISVKEGKTLLITKVITLDKFVQYQTGVIASRFYNNYRQPSIADIDTEKYQDTVFYKSLELENPDEHDFFTETIRTYERFIDFISSDDTIIDPTYLWDVIATPDEDLFATGLNIVIIEIASNEDTELHISCPVQYYSNSVFYDDKKPTWILIKRPLLSGEKYYEPIYRAIHKNGIRGAIVKDKVFLPEDAETLFPFLTTLDSSQCLRETNVEINPREITANYLFDLFQKKRFQIKKQVVNRYGKTVGFVVEKAPVMGQYIPCFPSILLSKTTQPLERVRLNATVLQKSLTTTIENLQVVKEKTGLPCIGSNLIVSYGDSPKIIGIKTEYLGYIPVVTEAFDENKPSNKLPFEYSSDPIEAEMNSVEPVKGEDIDLSHKYFLEKEFFLAFQGKIRNLLNEYRNEKFRREILRWIHYKPTTTNKENTVDENATFVLRYNRVLLLLRRVAEGIVIFNNFDPRILKRLSGVFSCEHDTAKRTEIQPYCLVRGSPDDGEDKMVFPKKNLVNPESDNETTYFSKLADALVRNHRVQNIVFQPFRFFNMLGSVDYQVNEDELLVG